MSRLKKFRESYWLYSGFFYALQKLCVPLFSILYTVLLAHRLSKEEMGEWSIFLILSGFAEMVRAGLIRNPLIKFLNDQKIDDEKRIISAAFLWNIIITVLLSAGLLIFRYQLAALFNSTYFPRLVFIFIMGLFVLIPFSHLEWVLIARLKFNTVFWGYFIRQLFVLTAILLYSFFVKEISLYVISSLYVSGVLIGVIYFTIRYRRYLILAFSGQVYVWMKDIFSFGKYVFGTVAASLLFRTMPPFFVSHYYNPGLLAGQNIADRITNFLDMPSQVMADIVFPKNAQLSGENDGDRIKYLYEKAVGASLAISIFPTIILILVSRYILFLFGGLKYLEATGYLQVVFIAMLLMPFLKQCGITLDSTGRPKVNFLINLFIGALNVVLCIILIPAFGLIGAAYAILFSLVTSFVIVSIILKKYYGINVFNSFKYSAGFYKQGWGIAARFIGAGKRTAGDLLKQDD